MFVVNFFGVMNKLSRIKSNVSDAAKSRVPKIRTTWAKENERITDRMFYRLFRMKRPCFNALCSKIERAIGEKSFRSERYIQKLAKDGNSTPESRMYYANLHSSGTYIPGKVQLAITLCLLAGASYLDMFLWFNVCPDHARKIARVVMENWICNDDVICINFFQQVLQDTDMIQEISSLFSSRSDGVLNGCIGALDGWLVKIFCPTKHDAENPGKYFSRKGFYALNVQVIVDMKKRVLWRFIGEKGSAHDSPVFNESKLGMFMFAHAASFFAKGLYLVGDSAYALRPYLLTPHNNVKSGSKEDNYNFFQSSTRIYVECAFGEIDRRWGIFWRPLQGSLSNHKYTIDSALRLHNFIIDWREAEIERQATRNAQGMRTLSPDDIEDIRELDIASRTFMIANPFALIGTYSEGSEEDRARGRPTNEEKEIRNQGKMLREKITATMRHKGLLRPSTRRKMQIRDEFNSVNMSEN